MAVVILSLATGLGLYALQHRLASTWLAFSLHPDVRDAVSGSLGDQKRLAELDPDHRSTYRDRFESLHRLETRLAILELNRETMTRRYDLILIGIFFTGLLVISSWYLFERRRQDHRLAAIRTALNRLSEGNREVRIGDRSADTVGRIGRMIEEASRVMLRDRRRIETLRHLQAWQEAARRHAHEIRTPLTSLQLGVERLADAARHPTPESDTDTLIDSVRSELEALRRFTREYSSFGTIGEPKRRTVRLAPFVDEFCTTFQDAWRGIRIDRKAAGDCVAELDPDLIRRVLANLCTNSARAMPRGGRIHISSGEEDDLVFILHRDEGEGIPALILDRLFEPYNTASPPGDGMGLGLAIARKIMLDHQGDLELVSTGPDGTIFRLLFPRISGDRP